MHLKDRLTDGSDMARWPAGWPRVVSEPAGGARWDLRVKPCLVNWLRFRMKKYAAEFRWAFDDKDFDALGAVEPL
jgi:hypothetical protein